MGLRTGFLSFLISNLFTSRCLACGADLALCKDYSPSIIPTGWPRGTPRFFEFLRRRISGGEKCRFGVLCPFCWLKMEPRPGYLEYNVEGVPAVSPFRTDEILLKVIRYIKFQNGRAAAGPLSWWMALALSSYLDAAGLYESSKLVLIPVPLHGSRKRKRGYNQSGLLASGVSEMTAIPVLDRFLFRVVKTKSQSNLDLEERRRNVFEAFQINYPAIAPPGGVILVDDLVTTGETAAECVRVLSKSGCLVRAVLSAGVSL